MKNKYTMPKLIGKYYKNWINSPTLLDHPSDEERFFRFVKACNKWGKKRRNGHWLKYFLERDLKSEYTEEYFNEVCSRAVSKFDDIIDYLEVSFPDHLVEMRNPIIVACELRRLTKENGEPFMTNDEIKDYIREKFVNS